jgi:ubiquinone/menaquinone biosynthesis C-methylase UbiE
MLREPPSELMIPAEDVHLQQLQHQRDTWNRYSSGWKKWDHFIMQAMEPVANVMINSLNLKGNEKILDIASGTGEPGLKASTLLPDGSVTGTDLSECMVVIANENARIRNIRNYSSLPADAENLPFYDELFDHVMCRFGIMFFPDMKQSVNEMARVLKKGGKMTTAVWAAPEKNPFISIIGSVIRSKLGLKNPPLASPNLFRCADHGLTSGLLRETGLDDVCIYNLSGYGFFESAGHYWEVMSDIAGPLMEALENSPRNVVEDVRRTVIELVSKYTWEGGILTPWEAVIMTAVKQ